MSKQTVIELEQNEIRETPMGNQFEKTELQDVAGPSNVRFSRIDTPMRLFWALNCERNGKCAVSRSSLGEWL